MPTLQVRVDLQDKDKASAILHRLGLNLSSAVNIFLKTIIKRKGIPFLLLTENGFTPEQEAELLKLSAKSKKSKKSFSSVKALMQELNK